YGAPMRIFGLIPCLTLLALLPACLGESETTYTDVGSACVSGEVDMQHSVEVDFHQCVSSSCDTVVESSCEVTRDGDTLTVTATATIASKGGTCTLDCGMTTASCETPALAAGSYQLVYGDMQTTLTVPAATPGEPTCAGEP